MNQRGVLTTNDFGAQTSDLSAIDKAQRESAKSFLYSAWRQNHNM